MTCPSCGAAVPAQARFCPACGHSVVTRPDERRIATVVFADLVSFTSYSELNDPEQVKNLVDRCFARLAEDVTSFGGQVDKIVGDAMVALFGAPLAHEDDAERAVRAALRMQETLGTLREETGVPVQMRVGVNTGEVLVGALRAGGDYTAMGDVVNTASRLQQLAAPGEVVVGPATRAASGAGMRYEPLGPVTVKGREEPVNAWRALEATAPPGLRKISDDTPLVGRDGELAILQAALARAVQRNRAHGVLLVGEAGVGKTRLASELGGFAARDHDALVLHGRCVPYGEANVWFPLAEAIASACGVEPSDSLELVRERVRAAVLTAVDLADDQPEADRLTDGLLYLLGHDSGRRDVDPSRARDDAHRAMFSFLGGLAAARPVLLVLSDLHWADDQLLVLLDRLLERVQTRPLLLVGTMRPELEERWTPGPGKHDVVVLHLDPLTPADAEVLARSLAGGEMEEELVAMVRDRSGGNPFFIQELAVMVSDCPGALGTGSEVPATLRGLVSARLDQLPADERAVLDAAAVVGLSGPVEMVALIAEGGGSVELTLDQLANNDLLVLTDGEFSFRNSLIRDIAYSTLTKAERARRHGQLAWCLATDAEAEGRLDEALGRLAYHYTVATSLLAEVGDVPGLPSDMAEKAVRFLARAADQAELREEWSLADRYLSHALGALPDDDEAARLQLLLQRAKARVELRNCPGARDDVSPARRLAETLDDRGAVAMTTTILGEIQHREGELLASADTLDDAIAQWRALGDVGGVALALRARGLTDIFRGELAGGREFLREALDIYRSIGDRRGEAWALQHLGWIAFSRGQYSDAESVLDESLTAFGELGDWGGVSWALGLLAWVRFTQGRLEEAHNLATRILKDATDLGNRWAAAIMQVLLANLTLWRGNTDDAIRLTEQAREIFRELGDAWGELQSFMPAVIALDAGGRLAEADAAMAQAREVAARVPDMSMRRLPDLLSGVLAVHRGEPVAADLARAAVKDVASDDGFVRGEQQALVGLALLQGGHLDDALTVLDGDPTTDNPDIAVNLVRAAALIADGRPDDALELCDAIGEGAITFVDRYRLALNRAFAHARMGDDTAAQVALAEAESEVDVTDARLDQLIVRVARAALLGATPQADAAAAAARDRAAALGIRPVGWERLFALLLGRAG